MDPEIFLNQKILGPYVPTAEPMAAILVATRKIKKFDIRIIVAREIERANSRAEEKVKSIIPVEEVEEAKINFSQPKNLFHLLMLNSLSGNLTFDKRIEFVIREYEKIMKKTTSFYQREVIRENFINGIQQTLLYAYFSKYDWGNGSLKIMKEQALSPESVDIQKCKNKNDNNHAFDELVRALVEIQMYDSEQKCFYLGEYEDVTSLQSFQYLLTFFIWEVLGKGLKEVNRSELYSYFNATFAIVRNSKPQVMTTKNWDPFKKSRLNTLEESLFYNDLTKEFKKITWLPTKPSKPS